MFVSFSLFLKVGLTATFESGDLVLRLVAEQRGNQDFLRGGFLMVEVQHLLSEQTTQFLVLINELLKMDSRY